VIFKKINIFGFHVILICYILSVVFSGIFHLFLSESLIYNRFLIAVALISLSYFLLLIGLFIAKEIYAFNSIVIRNSYHTHSNYILICSVVYLIITNSIDLHQLGNARVDSNPPFLEGISEIISRYLLPACGYIAILNNYFKNNGKFFQSLIYSYVFPVIVLYSIYIDIFIKFSKQVVITWILVMIISNIRRKFIKSIHVFIILLTALLSFSYITFTRILSLEEFSFVGLFDKDGPIFFLMEVIYHRLVGVRELYNLLDLNVELLKINFMGFSNNSVANLYTNSVYGLPINGGTSSAPGLAGFFIYSFGYFGIIGCVPLGILIFTYFKILCLFSDLEYAKIISYLLLFLLLIDGVIDERFFSSFPLKIAILHLFFILISRTRWHSTSSASR
jgi:hypothetical protein